MVITPPMKLGSKLTISESSTAHNTPPTKPAAQQVEGVALSPSTTRQVSWPMW
jgi:hypothetical protein